MALRLDDNAAEQTLPTSRSELSELLDFLAEIKRKLVGFVSEAYANDVRAQLATQSRNEPITESAIKNAIETVIYDKRFKNGETVIDRFVSESSELSPREAAIVLGWRDSLFGVFHLERGSGPIAESVNLVDDMRYRLVTNNDIPEVRRMLRSRGFLLSRIVPVLDAWMLSGGQTILKASEKKVAYGMAAEMAQQAPHLFFRNPKNLEKALDVEEKRYQRFVDHFGAPWIVGTAREIENRWYEFMLPDAEESIAKETKEMLRLPRSLHKAKTVGMIQDPREGQYFLEDFGIFLDALHDPSKAKERQIREVLFGYLEDPSVSPCIFSLASKERPDRLNEMLAQLLDHQNFDWDRDGEDYLRKHNPQFIERPRIPSTLPLNNDLVDGLKYLKERDAAKASAGKASIVDEMIADDDFFATDKMPSSRSSKENRKKTKAKRKHARKTRKRNRK